MRLFIRPDRREWPSILQRPTKSTLDILGVVDPIFDAVRERGDEALRELTLQFDGTQIEAISIQPDELEASPAHVDEALKKALRTAAANIETFHRAQLVDEAAIETTPGVTCWRKNLPIEKVGLYVPGGSAPLVSSVLMLGIPARIAGCSEIALCTPPRSDGSVDPAILFAASLVGVTHIFRVGGAQAIAALAYGTESVPAVYKICGPGNQYVTAAKLRASLEGVATDMPAGPTEVAIVVDESCPVDFVVYDALAQAEHGPDSHIVVVTFSEEYARSLISKIEKAVDSIPRSDFARTALSGSVCVVLSTEDDAIDLCNSYAPEHLILATRDAERLAGKVRAAGSVFVGVMSPESAGDYASGTNHTLPTGGAARAYSGVSVDSFVNKVTFQSLSRDGIRNLGPTIMTLAEAEGLTAHAQAVSVRLEAVES